MLLTTPVCSLMTLFKRSGDMSNLNELSAILDDIAGTEHPITPEEDLDKNESSVNMATLESYTTKVEELYKLHRAKQHIKLLASEKAISKNVALEIFTMLPYDEIARNAESRLTSSASANNLNYLTETVNSLTNEELLTGFNEFTSGVTTLVYTGLGEVKKALVGIKSYKARCDDKVIKLLATPPEVVFLGTKYNLLTVDLFTVATGIDDAKIMYPRYANKLNKTYYALRLKANDPKKNDPKNTLNLHELLTKVDLVATDLGTQFEILSKITEESDMCANPNTLKIAMQTIKNSKPNIEFVLGRKSFLNELLDTILLLDC